MLLRSQHVVIESRLSPDAVLAQLKLRAHDVRESALTPAGRAAGAVGWIVRVRSGRLVVTPRIASQSGFLPEFAGEIQPTATGSVVRGHLRVHWFPRALLLVWLTAVGAGLLASMKPGFGAVVIVPLAVSMMLLPFVAIVFAAGPWRTDRPSSLAGVATLEMLGEAARGDLQQ